MELTGFGTGLRLICHESERIKFGCGADRFWNGVKTNDIFRSSHEAAVVELTGFGTGLRRRYWGCVELFLFVVELTGFGTGLRLQAYPAQL